MRPLKCVHFMCNLSDNIQQEQERVWERTLAPAWTFVGGASCVYPHDKSCTLDALRH